ncbi:MAG: Gfo/Idh/MocA family oxidoreductase, partial [bacterium]|nr:Gfo/Idh/MocA family oxidoreductase [bacterium]
MGGRGCLLGRTFAALPNVELAYICDLDESRGRRMGRELDKIQGTKPKRVNDMRRILEDKDVDGVIVATPEHWHGLATVWACQAGKDVYVEKTPAHNIWEGRKMVEAARKYKRVVQVGTQNRSAAYLKEAREYIQSGALGDIPFCRVHNLKGGTPYTEPADSSVPRGVDYDMWLGPAPKRSFNKGHFHGGERVHWVYSGGDMADDGIHQLDVA